MYKKSTDIEDYERWCDLLSYQEFIKYFSNINGQECFEGLRASSPAITTLLKRRKRILIELLYS